MNFISSDCCSQIFFQERALAHMRIHLGVEEAVLSSRIPRARECNVRASKKLIDSYLPPPRLRYSHIRVDAYPLDTDLNIFLYLLDQGTSNRTGDLGVNVRQTQGKLVVTNS